jgi:hypothetical protein
MTGACRIGVAIELCAACSEFRNLLATYIVELALGGERNRQSPDLMRYTGKRD